MAETNLSKQALGQQYSGNSPFLRWMFERVIIWNPMGHSWDFKFRRFANWLPLGFTYATLYMGRYNVNVASSLIMEKFALAKAEFGVIITAGFWTYAFGCLINGPLSDRLGGRKAMLIGTFGSAIINLIIGIFLLNEWTGKIIVMMSFFYAINQYFQSFAALAIVKVNSPWFNVRERGVFGGVFGILISLGYSLAYAIGGLVLANMSWYWVFIVPAICMFVMYALDFFILKDKPSQAGFLDMNTGDASSQDPDKDKPVDWNFLIKKIFSNPVILLLALAEFCTAFGRYGIMSWFVPFLKEAHGVTPGTTLFSYASIGITIGGVLGGLSIGYFSDKFFNSRRPPMAGIYYMLQIISMGWLVTTPSPATACFLIGFNCVWALGIHGILSGTCSMDFGGTRGASTVTGLFNSIHYVAAGLTGFMLGKALDAWGWGAWFWCVAPFSLAGALIMMYLWNETPTRHRH